MTKQKNKWYKEETAKKWEELHALYKDLGFSKPSSKNALWIFRAQKWHKNSPLLETKIEEAFERFKPDKAKKNGNHYSRSSVEKALIQEFQRKAALYIEHPPEQDDILGWLALMQHHGAPTRLLDFTYSFFVAAFFAINELDCNKEKAEVWAINAKKFSFSVDELKNKLTKKQQLKIFDKLLSEKIGEISNRKDVAKGLKEKLKDNAFIWRLINMEKPPCLVYPVTPFKLNKRLTVQQGTFLITGNIEKSFEENLRKAKELFGSDPKQKESLYRIVLDFKNGIKKRNDILRKLHSMNISSAALFPDLDGFAKSLWGYLAFPERLGISIEDKENI